MRFLGVHEDLGVAMQLDADDRDITVANAEFSRCQHALACILAQGRGLTVEHVRFHDVRDADVIRGAADDVTIRDSDLHDALPGTHGDNHNDLIQILGGGPWTIERCHFGVRANGAAQIYLDPRSGPAGPVHDVHILSSLFTGSNADMYFAINVRDPAESKMPLASGVEIVNNTIVSANTAAITLADEYGKQPVSSRPLIQNNILGLPEARPLRRRPHAHERHRAAASPARGDRGGDPQLSATDRPTTASEALLGDGTADAAPATDLAGRERAAPPAVGAYELP